MKMSGDGVLLLFLLSSFLLALRTFMLLFLSLQLSLCSVFLFLLVPSSLFPSLSLLVSALPLTPISLCSPVLPFHHPLLSSFVPDAQSPSSPSPTPFLTLPLLLSVCQAIFLPSACTPTVPVSTPSHLCRSLECNVTHTACEK